MIHISGDLLNNTLDLTEQIDAANETSYGDSGPGNLDKHKLFLGNERNSWLQRKPKNTKRHKKKLVFANALLNDLIMDEKEYAFLVALIENYEVYLYPGDQAPLSDCQPVRNIDEFLEKLHQVQPATKSRVQEVLGRQGLEGDDYIVLDYENYFFALALVKENFNRYIEYERSNHKKKTNDPYIPSLQLDLSLLPSYSPFELQRVLKSVGTGHVAEIKMTAPDISALREMSRLQADFIAVNINDIGGADTQQCHQQFLRGSNVGYCEQSVSDHEICYRSLPQRSRRPPVQGTSPISINQKIDFESFVISKDNTSSLCLHPEK